MIREAGENSFIPEDPRTALSLKLHLLDALSDPEIPYSSRVLCKASLAIMTVTLAASITGGIVNYGNTEMGVWSTVGNYAFVTGLGASLLSTFVSAYISITDAVR